MRVAQYRCHESRPSPNLRFSDTLNKNRNLVLAMLEVDISGLREWYNMFWTDNFKESAK